jgi:hypothetical protein
MPNTRSGAAAVAISTPLMLIAVRQTTR